MMDGVYRTFYLLTLGCKVNQYESDLLRRQCVDAGLAEVDGAAGADLVIVNTCGVTANAVGKSRRAVRAVRHSAPRAVAATGCAVDLERADFEMDGVQLFKQSEKSGLLYRMIGRGNGAAMPECGRTRALLKIQDGCNQFCSYCVVPAVRSALWSKNFEAAVDEARYLAGRGHREIVLTGVRLGLYDGGGGRGLAALLDALGDVEGLERVRLSSLEILEVNEELLEAMGRSRVFCRHLHLPLQSGDDGVLKRMNRPYCAAEYLKRVAEIRARLGRMAITTDVIVGFPGETEEAFENTLAACREAGFSKIHIFPFSVRKGTAAAAMDGAVSAEEMRRRARKLALLEKRLAVKYRKEMVGEIAEVLVERRENGAARGKTRDYVTVEFAADCAPGDAADVRIEKAGGLILQGTLMYNAKDNECQSRKKSCGN